MNPFLFAGQQPQAPLITQPTAFLVSAVPNTFNNFLSQGQVPQLTGHIPPFTQQQTTGMLQPTGALLLPQPFIQPQMTGANPFRQSTLIPQTTGMQLFGVGTSAPQSQTTMNVGQAPNGLSPFSQSTTPLIAPKSSFGPISLGKENNTPARPASTPLTSPTVTTTTTPQPVKTHQTGTKNPFGPIAPPSVPKSPTLFELSTGLFNQNKNEQPQHETAQHVQSQPTSQPMGLNRFNFGNSSLNPGAVDISSVASSFALANNKPISSGAASTPLTTNSTDPESTKSAISFQNTLGSNPMASPNQPSNAPFMANSTSSINPVKSHLTGMAGLKPFKPTSSFGASLFESLPPIAGSDPATPAAIETPLSSNASIPAASTPSSITASTSTASIPANPLSTNTSFLSSHPTGATGGFGTSFLGSTLGVGLRPQMTAGGVSNPFRASMAGNLYLGGSDVPPMPSLPTGFGGMKPFGSVNGSGSTGLGTNQLGAQNHMQPNGTTSLI